MLVRGRIPGAPAPAAASAKSREDGCWGIGPKAGASTPSPLELNRADIGAEATCKPSDGSWARRTLDVAASLAVSAGCCMAVWSTLNEWFGTEGAERKCIGPFWMIVTEVTAETAWLLGIDAA